jgi:hypothetical protein
MIRHLRARPPPYAEYTRFTLASLIDAPRRPIRSNHSEENVRLVTVPVFLIWYDRTARDVTRGLRAIMPCFVLLVLLLFPRVALVLMWIYSTYLQRAFHGGLVLPVLGFIFLPLTTIVYAWELNSGMPTSGINLLWLLIAVIIDLGGLGGGAHRQSRR